LVGYQPWLNIGSARWLRFGSARTVLNDPFADASDQRRHFRELYELTAKVLTAHGEAGLASSDFVNALQSELKHWVSKRKNERRPA
jgi:hypothetical protein